MVVFEFLVYNTI